MAERCPNISKITKISLTSWMFCNTIPITKIYTVAIIILKSHFLAILLLKFNMSSELMIQNGESTKIHTCF